MKGDCEMGLLSWIIVGLIAGWLANQMMRGGRGNAGTDIVVGIIGGLVGGFLAAQLFGVPNACSTSARSPAVRTRRPLRVRKRNHQASGPTK